MKNIFKYLLLFTFVAISGSVFAQKAPKFGHVNSQDLIISMPEMDSAQVKLQAYQKELESTLESLNVEFNKKYQAYQNEEKTLTDLIKQTRMNELQDYSKRIQDFEQSAQQEMQKKQNELYQPVIAKAKKAIEDYGKENGFTMIYESTVLQYMSAEVIDILPALRTKMGIKAKPATSGK